jgi:hypothetical protein
VVALGCIAGTLVACGDDDTKPAQTGDVPSTDAPSSTAPPAAPAAIDITGADFSFDLGGTTEV